MPLGGFLFGVLFALFTASLHFVLVVTYKSLFLSLFAVSFPVLLQVFRLA
jgi:hypothetical protein